MTQRRSMFIASYKPLILLIEQCIVDEIARPGTERYDD
jgi:hypothetical protein